jgi:5-dehydro-2-deoxygluconokinase
VLLGLSAPRSELVASFAAAAPCGIVKGFAVGRTIFEEIAHDWFRGKIGDESAVKRMAVNLAALVSAWRHTRAETLE